MMEQISNTVMATVDEINSLAAEGWRLGHAAGKREAAEHILDLWRQPWPVTEKPFIKLLEAYVEELKCK